MEQSPDENSQPRESVDLFRDMARESVPASDDQMRSTFGLENPVNENAHMEIIGG